MGVAAAIRASPSTEYYLADGLGYRPVPAGMVRIRGSESWTEAASCQAHPDCWPVWTPYSVENRKSQIHIVEWPFFHSRINGGRRSVSFLASRVAQQQ